MSLHFPVVNFAISLVLAAICATACLSLSSVTKRLGAALLLMLAIVMAAASLHLAGGILIAGVAAALMLCVLGTTLIARLQETYGAIEIDEVDALDREEETAERST